MTTPTTTTRYLQQAAETLGTPRPALTPKAFDTAEAGNPGDGEKSIAWSVAEPGNLPTDVIAVQPDHQVDFILVAVDLAGNIGYSDSDTTTSGIGVVVDDPTTDDERSHERASRHNHRPGTSEVGFCADRPCA